MEVGFIPKINSWNNTPIVPHLYVIIPDSFFQKCHQGIVLSVTRYISFIGEMKPDSNYRFSEQNQTPILLKTFVSPIRSIRQQFCLQKVVVVVIFVINKSDIQIRFWVLLKWLGSLEISHEMSQKLWYYKAVLWAHLTKICIKVLWTSE